MLSDLRTLRALREIAATRSFSAAAEKLGYTQSAVSQQIAVLEREVGMTLVDRVVRPVSLTDAGETLLRTTIPVFEHLGRAEAELDELKGLRTGRLRIASFPSAYATFLASVIAVLAREHPGVAVELIGAEPDTSLPLLRAGEVDLAVGYEWTNLPEASDPSVVRRHLLDDELKVVVPAGHRLARRRSVSINDLASERWIVPRSSGPAAGYRRMLKMLCEEAGFTPEVVIENDDLQAVQAFAAAGLGIVLMNDLTIPTPRPDVAIRPLRDGSIARRVYAATVRGRRWPPAEALLELLLRQ